MNKTLLGDPIADTRPDPDAVRKLVDQFGYKREAVAKWSRARVVATLEARLREDAIAVRRAEAKAGEQDGTAPRGRVPTPLRQAAAEYLRDAIAHGPDEVCLALSYSCCFLQDDEAKKLAGYMAGKFEGRE